eukprot:gene12817-biopygen2645
MSGRACLGEHVRASMSGRACLGEEVRAPGDASSSGFSERRCQGEHVWASMSGRACLGAPFPAAGRMVAQGGAMGDPCRTPTAGRNAPVALSVPQLGAWWGKVARGGSLLDPYGGEEHPGHGDTIQN